MSVVRRYGWSTFFHCVLAAALVGVVTCDPYLDINVRLSTDNFCGADMSCEIDYTIAVLKSNGYDLISDKFVESTLSRTGENSFEDSTVVLVDGKLVDGEAPVYLGFKLLSGPPDIQKYFILDVMDVARNGTRFFAEYATNNLKVSVHMDRKDTNKFEEPSLKASADYDIPEDFVDMNPDLPLLRRLGLKSHCKCNADQECTCCRHLNFAKINLDERVCLKVKLNPSKTIRFDTKLHFDRYVGGASLTPSSYEARKCHSVWHLHPNGRICVEVYNVQKHANGSVDACFDALPMQAGVLTGRQRMGCIRIRND